MSSVINTSFAVTLPEIELPNGLTPIVSLDMVKEHLRVSNTDHDEWLNKLLLSCQDYVANELGVTLVQQEYMERITPGRYQLRLANRPVVSVSEVKEVVGTFEQALPLSWFGVDQYGLKSDVPLNPGRRRYQVTYVGGYGPLCPPPLGIVNIVLALMSGAYKGELNKSSGSSQGSSEAWSGLRDGDINKMVSSFSLKDVM